MWTGRQTLASIEDAIVQLHGEENQLDHALRSAVSDTERLRTQRSQACGSWRASSSMRWRRVDWSAISMPASGGR